MLKPEQRDSIRYMTETVGWELVGRFIQERIDDKKGQLMTCKTWEDVQQHRAGAAALESVLLFIQQSIQEANDSNESSD